MAKADPIPDAAEALMSRREFAKMSMAAGIVATGGAGEAAERTVEHAVDIRTSDGVADAVLVAPRRGGPSPAVILYPDALGLRPVKVEMAKRLATEGYAVLVVNQFYRTGRAPVLPPAFDFADPADRARLTTLIGTLDHQAVTRDAIAFIALLDARAEVDRKARIGAVGFCMGGSMTIRAAAAVPDRVGAGVSFHGGGLVTDDPHSPHRLVAETRAAYHIGIAADDDAKEPQAKVLLRSALDAAHRPATIEVYPGTRHGWTVPGSAVYDPIQAERAWAAMLGLYKRALA